MWKTRWVKYALLALLLAGCPRSSSSPAAARPAAAAPAPDPTPAPATMSDADFEGLMTEMVAFVENLAGAVEGAKRDCAAMAAALDQVAADHSDFLARARKIDDPAFEDRADRWMAQHAGVGQAAVRIDAGVTTCRDDEAVKAALDRIGT